MPGTKLRLLASGSVEPLGQSVANPAAAPSLLSTVALPTSAWAAAGTVTSPMVNWPGRVSVSFAVRGRFGATWAANPAHVSNNRTGCANGKNCRPTSPGAATRWEMVITVGL